MDRIMLKERAKEQIKGKIGVLFVIHLIVFVITYIASFIPVVGAIAVAVLLSPAFTLSITSIYLNVVAGNTPKAGDVFDGFYDFWSAFKVLFLIGLFTFLWSLLFVIPGIVKAYSYSMALKILAENKGMSALEAIRLSKQMTNGKKMDLFVLDLSFIGWGLLCAVTCGIAGIWVIPYMQATYTNYYNEMKSEPVVMIESPEV